MAGNSFKRNGDILPSSDRKRKKPRTVISGIQDDSLLTKTLEQHLFYLQPGDSPHIIGADQAMFIKAFSKDVSTHLEYPNNIDEMLETLFNYCEDVGFLRKSLLSTNTSPDCDSARNDLQDSLIRLMLCVPDLQTKLLIRLLEILAEIALTSDSSTGEQVLETSLPRLILSSIRFLPFTMDSNVIAEKLMEILQACPNDLQREIILSLPEIVEDSQHEKIAASMKELLNETRNLTCTILDSLSSMSLSKSTVKELLNVVLKRLYRVNMRDLPSVVEFLLCSAQAETDVLSVVQELRDRLDISSVSKDDAEYRSRPIESEDTQSRVIEIIHFQSLINKNVSDAWMKCIDMCSQDDLKSLDMLILLAFYDLQKKSVENILKKKIRNGLLTESLLKSIIHAYGSVLKKYFQNVISLGDMLLSSTESNINDFGIALYTQTFLSFSEEDAHFQQDLIGDLISKIGTGGGGRITDAALGALEILAECHSKHLLNFIPMITAMMDFTENMNLGQFRQLMYVLCSIAWQKGAAESTTNLKSEINIMMKKQLHSKSLALKKMGVIGAVSSVRAIGKHNSTYDKNCHKDTSSSSKTTSKHVSSIVSLIDMALEETKFHPEAAGLLMDELAAPPSVSVMPVEVASEYADRFQDIFESDFIVDDPKENQAAELGLQILFKLNANEGDSMEEEADIVIPIAKWILDARKNPINISTKIHRFIPHFRLLCALKPNHGDIDALLGCGVLMVSSMVPEDQEKINSKDLDSVCDMVFFSLNWFREVVNYFSTVDDEETRKQILLRIKNILHLEDSLKILLQRNQLYRPPTVIFSEDAQLWSPQMGHTKSRGKGEKGKTSKGNPKNTSKKLNETTMNATMHLNTQVSQIAPIASSTVIGQSQAAEKKNPLFLRDLDEYRPFFRELDLNILKILEFEVITIGTKYDDATEKSDPRFRPSELSFIMKDLSEKLDARLKCGKKKSFPGCVATPSSFGNTNLMRFPEKTVLEVVLQVFPKLFANMDLIRDYFAEQIRIYDGILDTDFSRDENYDACMQCLRYGFNIASTIFSWQGFKSMEMQGILLKSLTELVQRLENTERANKESLSFELVLEKIVRYMATFTDSIVCSEVGSHHLDLLHALSHLNTASKYNKQVSAQTALVYLKKNWFSVPGKEKTIAANLHVQKFLTVFLEHTEDPLSEIETIFDVGVQDLFENRGKDYKNAVFKTFQRSSVGVVYQICLQKLVQIVKINTFGNTKDKDELLEIWSTTTALLQKVVNPLKTWRNRSILKTVLKFARQYLDQFLRHAMPLLDGVFKRKGNDCINILKTLQSSTRYLHVICTSTKTDHEIALASYVPFLKKSLEALVYRVQAMLAANNCGDAFWMGNLKNRDLQGEEILTQVADEEDEDEEDEVDEEEAEADEELDDASGVGSIDFDEDAENVEV